jgi:hypothetical protein
LMMPHLMLMGLEPPSSLCSGGLPSSLNNEVGLSSQCLRRSCEKSRWLINKEHEALRNIEAVTSECGVVAFRANFHFQLRALAHLPLDLKAFFPSRSPWRIELQHRRSKDVMTLKDFAINAWSILQVEVMSSMGE